MFFADNMCNEEIMPITFILSGVLFLLNIFGIFKLKNKFENLLLIFSLLFCIVSFFVDDLKFNVFGIDIFSLFSIFFVLILTLKYYQINLTSLVFIFVTLAVFNNLISSNKLLLIEQFDVGVFLLVVLLSYLLSSKFSNALFYAIVSSVGIELISCFHGIKYLGYSLVDFNFCYLILCGVLCVYLIKSLIKYLVLNRYGRVYSKRQNLFFINFEVLL